MKQHNAATKDGRNCWGSARERERMKARFNIRQRVNHSNAVVGPSVSKPLPAGDVLNTEYSHEVISKYLSYILRGDKSKFSTTFMDRHFGVIYAQHSIRCHILENPDTLSKSLKVAKKLRGPSYVQALSQHMESVSTFTFMEYAVWMGKYSIVSGMLHGGINPCVRGSAIVFGSVPRSGLKKLDQLLLRQRQHLTEIGSRVLKRFFDCFPLRLSTYIVKRVVDMRIVARVDSHWQRTNENCSLNAKDVEFIICNKMEAEKSHNDAATFRCPICCDQISNEFKLQFGRCKHVFCEMCFWNDLMVHIDSPEKCGGTDVISCLACGEIETREDALLQTDSNTRFLHEDISDLSPIEKYKLSMERLHRLPVDQHELKKRTSKKKRLSEEDYVASNWLDAVFPSLGSTQDIRKDKFMLHVERNAITYVKGCLLSGVDVNQVNEYGQSAVYLAAWRGYEELVALLLGFGADPCIPANGGSTVRGLCSAGSCRKNTTVLELLDQYESAPAAGTIRIGCDARDSADTQRMHHLPTNNPMSLLADGGILPNHPRRSILIPSSSDHPGAGSCFIDEAISSETTDALLDLFRSLPVDTNQKEKKNSAPCSDRSYYCDTEGSLRLLLGNAVVRGGLASTTESLECVTDNNHSAADNNGQESPSLVRVFPHMRFLHYSRPGTVLPPHIDLCRVNPFCRPSDKQNPRYRSTHTFILYLTDCLSGGETALLEEVTADGSSPSLAVVSPRRGRLLVFPHVTPHKGMEVGNVPKILLRGELQIHGT